MSESITQEKEEQTSVAGTLEVQPNDTRIDTIFLGLKKEFNTWHKRKEDLIVGAAIEISKLPGIDKSLIAATMYDRAVKFEIDITRRFIYQVLPKEFKNARRSEASSRVNRQRAETFSGVEPKDYNMDVVTLYPKNTLVLIVVYLDALKKTLSAENDALKKQIEALKQ